MRPAAASSALVRAAAPVTTPGGFGVRPARAQRDAEPRDDEPPRDAEPRIVQALYEVRRSVF